VAFTDDLGGMRFFEMMRDVNSHTRDPSLRAIREPIAAS